MSDEQLILNTPEDSELAVVHTRHGNESCNRDDMHGRELVDPETADALLATGEARWCQHCQPKEEPS